MFKKLNIGSKIILGYLIVALIMGLSGVLLYYVVQKIVVKEIGENTALLATEILDEIDRGIYTRLEELSLLIQNPLIIKTIMASNERFESMPDPDKYIKEQDEEWIKTYKSDDNPTLERLLEKPISKELKDIVEFYEKEYGYNVFAEIFITNKFGANTAQTGKTTDYNQSDEAWWIKAKENGFFIGDVQYDESAEVYSIDMAVAIKDDNGNFMGVAKAVLNVREVFNTLTEFGKIQEKTKNINLHLLLMKNNGDIIYNSEIDNDFFAHKHCEECLKRIVSSSGFFVFSGMEKVKVLAAYACSEGYKKYKGSGWILVIGFIEREILDPVYNLGYNILIITLITVMMAFLVGLVITRSISRPLAGLKQAVNRIDETDMNFNVDIKSKDELGELAGAFNRMMERVREASLALRNSLYSEKQKTDELETLKKELDVKIVQRTKELQEKVEKLNQTSKELENAQERVLRSEKLAVIGKLAGMMSHEIRNPLGVIRNSAYFINMRLKGGKDEKIKKHLKILQEEIDNADKIISDILTFSGVKPPELVKKDISKFIQGTLDKVLVPPDINVKTEFDNTLTAVPFDEIQMKHVFLNIIVNAFQSMESGGTLLIKTYRDGYRAVILFSDSGCGIEKGDIDRIFEPLFSKKTVGIGLGLTACLAIVQGHRGTIEVDSEFGKGSNFKVILPLEGNK